MEGRVFEVGHIAYKVMPTDDGGAIIERHEVTATGWQDGIGTFMDEDIEVKEKTLVPIIETDKNGKNIFEYEIHYVTIDELNKAVMLNINKKKLW